MAEKSVRDMSALERRHYSLSARVFRATLMGSVVLGLLALAIGLGLYTFALVDQCVSEAFNLSRNAAAILEKTSNVETAADAVMETYRSMSAEEREQMGTDAYREHYSHVQEGSNYRRILSVLNDFRESSEVYDIYLARYELKPARLIYIADPEEDEEKFAFQTGEWEAVEDREANKFLNWDGEGRLYDISLTKKYGWMCTAGMPIKNDEGETVAFVLADITLNEVSRGMKNFLFQYIIAMIAAVNLIGYLMTRRMKKTLVDPINDIAQAAQDYVKDKQAGVQETDHFSILNIRTGDEIENLSLVMADMERDISEFEETQAQSVAERERISTELTLATRIQADMLPSTFPAFPERTDLDIYASMTPAKEFGGDFYDFFLLDDNHLGLVMADVSGKGVPASLFMMISKILVQIYTMTGRSPREVLEVVNTQICRNNREDMFVTVWLGILDLTNGKLTASNAGHEYPILKSPNGRFELIKDKHSFVIGSLEGMHYKEYEMRLEPGSKLFLYTDGVPEATDAGNRLFGVERMLQALNEAATEGPQKVLESVHKAVNLFVGSAPQFDDLTMLCVEYLGQGSAEESPEERKEQG